MAVIKLSESKVNFVKEVCKSFNNDGGEVINVLHKVQGEFGYLPAEIQELVAKELNIPVSRVYGIVSFYSFSVCLGTACYVRGAEKVLDELKRQLGINVGEVTPDGKFSLTCLRCVGACGLAPVIEVGEKVYGRVTPDHVKDIIAEYR